MDKRAPIFERNVKRVGREGKRDGWGKMKSGKMELEY
jgi:hypothetical protein